MQQLVKIQRRCCRAGGDPDSPRGRGGAARPRHGAGRARAAREIDRDGRWREAVQAGQEIVRLSPPRRRAREEVEIYATAARRVDLAVRNLRVLARGALRASSRRPVPRRSQAGAARARRRRDALVAGLEDAERRAGVAAGHCARERSPRARSTRARRCRSACSSARSGRWRSTYQRARRGAGERAVSAARGRGWH